MAVRIGSARIDENGRASGGQAGDQTGMEVSTQDWYLHSKGWYVIRPNDATAAEKIACNMQWACDSKYIGYDQSQNNTLYNAVKPLGYNISKLRTYCETDCARLVRVCVLYAGINVCDFYTGNMKDALIGTGKFTLYTSDDYCKSSNKLKRGDILVTRTKGHTVVVLSNGSGASSSSTPSNSTSSSNTGNNVAKGQKWLNNNYPTIVKKCLDGKLLEVDNEYGNKTRLAVVGVWKDVMNRKHGYSFTVGNPNFGSACRDAANKVQVKQGDSGTIVYLIQLILSARGFYTSKMDGSFGSGTEKAVRDYQRSKNLSCDGVVGGNTLYALMN